MRHLIRKFTGLGILIIILFYIVIAAQYQYSNEVFIKNAEKLTRLSVSNLEGNVNKWLSKSSQVISDAADFIKLNTWTDQQINEYLKVLLQVNSSFSSIYYGSKENKMVNASGWIPPKDFDLTKRPWYLKAVEKGELAYTDAFLNASKDAMIITIACPVYDTEGKLMGVVGGDVFLTTIIDKITHEKLGKDGFSFLLDSTGNVLAHPRFENKNELEVYSMDEYKGVIEKILQSETGLETVRLEKTKGLLAFVPIEGVNWYLASFISSIDYAQQYNQVTFAFLFSTFSAFILFLIFWLLMRKYVKKPILELENNIEYISSNINTTFRLPVHRKDGFISLKRTINNLMDRLQVYLNKIAVEEEKIKELNESLRESEERWQFAITGSGYGVWDWNIQTKELYLSDRCKELFDIDKDENKNNFEEWKQRVHPSDLQNVLEENQRHFHKEASLYSYEYRILHEDGKIKWIHSRGKVVSWTDDGKALRMVGTHCDITDRKLVENKISYLSYHDSLTGLHNRAYFEEQLKRFDEEMKVPVALLLGDANGLKVVNDAFGHREGDRLLNVIAEILGISCRKQDIIARIGGDEFAIIMPYMEETEVYAVVKKIQELCKEEHGLPFKPSIAIGVAIKTNNELSLEAVYRQAEDRLYKNKLMESKSARSSIISSLKATLEERTHETEEHSNRLKELSSELGSIMGLNDSLLNDLELLAVLHDVGKVAIPDYILNKPGSLTAEEWDVMRKHSEIGYRIAIAATELASIADGILCHHERWDGIGYNQGLKGDQIPLISRIISIVDAYDAMTNDRPYRKALSKEQAIEELVKCAGTQFDPDIIKAFVEMLMKK